MSAVLQSPADAPVASPALVRLKAHVFFKPVEGGVHLDAGAQAFVLNGAGLYPLVERVVARMDAGTTLEALRRDVPERLRPVVRQLLEALDAHGMLLEESAEVGALLAEDGPPARREFVRYLQDRADAATWPARYTAWRTSRVVLAGEGFALEAAANALADAGAGVLRVRCASARVTADDLRERLAAAPHGPRLELREIASLDDLDLDDAFGDDAVALALFASDAADSTQAAAAFARHAQARGVPAVVAGLFNGHAFAVPAASADAATRAALPELLQWAPSTRTLAQSPASFAVLGAAAAQDALDDHFGIALPERARLARSVSPWLELRQHPLVGAGLAPRGDGLAPLAPLPAGAHALRLEMPEGRDLLPFERAKLALAPWFDALTGPLVAIGGGEARPDAQVDDIGALAQLPLYHDAIAVRAPAAFAAPARRVVGWGLDAQQAGLRALALALAALADATREADTSSPYAAAFDEARWQALARAHAVAAAPDFAARCHAAWLDAGAVDDETIHLLRQIRAHLGLGDARLLLRWDARGAVVAHCVVEGRVLGAACDTSARLALREALGQACSRQQVDGHALERGPAWLLPEPGAAQWRAAPPLDAEGDAPAAVRFAAAAGLALPPGVFCGRALLVEGEAA